MRLLMKKEAQVFPGLFKVESISNNPNHRGMFVFDAIRVTTA